MVLVLNYVMEIFRKWSRAIVWIIGLFYGNTTFPSTNGLALYDDWIFIQWTRNLIHFYATFNNWLFILFFMKVNYINNAKILFSIRNVSESYESLFSVT